MSATNTNPFAVDPYAHQPDSDWKTQRLPSDRTVLCDLLKMSEQEVYEASTSFAGREAEFFQFIFALRFLYHAMQNELKEQASTLKILSAVFTVEGVAPPALTSKKRLQQFCVKYLLLEEKRTFLTGFFFAKGHALGQPGTPARHLMREKALADAAFRGKHCLDGDPACCSSRPHSLCFCALWLSEQDERRIHRTTCWEVVSNVQRRRT